MDFPTVYTTASAQDTRQAGKDLAESCLKQIEQDKRIPAICLYGDLGSGKTTFVQGFAEGFGIHERMLSPTFIIVRQYSVPKIFTTLYHIDLFRIGNSDQLMSIGLDEILKDELSIVLIEWADRLGNRLPKERLDIHFEYRKEDSRILRIAYGQ